ncbi:hypothetical protein FRC17_006165, partial [Serendipita sp. 399]
NQQASRVLRHELTGPRTSIIPGVRGIPAHFGLFPDGLGFQVGSSHPTGGEGMNIGIDPSEFEVRPASQNDFSFWNDPHQPPSAQTPSSYSGYDSEISLSSWASSASAWNSAHTPASSQGNLPDTDFDNLNLEHDNNNIAHPIPVHANPHGVPLLNNPRAQSQPPNLGTDFGFDPYNDGSLQGLGSSGYAHPQPSRSRPQSQIGDPLLLSGFQLDSTGGASLLQTNPASGDYLSGEVSLSRYAQQRDHERRVSDAAAIGAFGNDFGLGGGLPTFGSYGVQGVGDGSVNLPFEVDASYGTMSGQPSVGIFPQMQGAGFDDHLFLHSTVGAAGGGAATAGTGGGGPTGGEHGFSSMSGFVADPMFSGADAYGVSQFSSQTQPTVLSLSQQQPNTTLVPNGSQPNSRRNSGYYQ